METTTIRRLNVGCGRDTRPGWINLDSADLPGIDVVADVDTCRDTPLPFPDDRFDEFLLSHLIEHIRDPLSLMQELHRIAAPGAKAIVRVPHGATDDAFEDPTHVRQYFPNSFGYFSQPYYWRADYGFRGDWKTEEVTLVVSRDEHEGMPPEEIMKRIKTLRNVVQEMVAKLIAVKPVREPRRELQEPPRILIAWDK